MENKVYVLFYTSLIIYGITIKATASKYFQKLHLHRDTLIPNCTLHVFFSEGGAAEGTLRVKTPAQISEFPNNNDRLLLCVGLYNPVHCVCGMVVL